LSGNTDLAYVGGAGVGSAQMGKVHDPIEKEARLVRVRGGGPSRRADLLSPCGTRKGAALRRALSSAERFRERAIAAGRQGEQAGPAIEHIVFARLRLRPAFRSIALSAGIPAALSGPTIAVRRFRPGRPRRARVFAPRARRPGSGRPEPARQSDIEREQTEAVGWAPYPSEGTCRRIPAGRSR
jgi:hypothetical protein